MKIHHLGIVVKDIEKGIILYESLGYVRIGNIIKDEIQYNYLVFMKHQTSEQMIELIQAADERSPVFKPNNQGYHHICFEVNSLDKDTQFLKENKKGKVFTPPIIAPAFNGRKIVFAVLENGTIIEFLEK